METTYILFGLMFLLNCGRGCDRYIFVLQSGRVLLHSSTRTVWEIPMLQIDTKTSRTRQLSCCENSRTRVTLDIYNSYNAEHKKRRNKMKRTEYNG